MDIPQHAEPLWMLLQHRLLQLQTGQQRRREYQTLLRHLAQLYPKRTSWLISLSFIDSEARLTLKSSTFESMALWYVLVRM